MITNINTGNVDRKRSKMSLVKYIIFPIFDGFTVQDLGYTICTPTNYLSMTN